MTTEVLIRVQSATVEPWGLPIGDPRETTVTTYYGDTYVWELFPARIDDGRPYEPLLYVGRWPD
mgnify:CR=1 FL=1